jgi:predicted Fe-Mo cluster-binding NifX family protein
MRSIKKGATTQTVYFDLLDTSSTTGGRKTGLTFNSSGIIASYTRNQAAAVQIGSTGTLVTQTASGAWVSGGFAEVSSSIAPGLYRLDVPDAAFATGADSVEISMHGVTGMAPQKLEIPLVDNTAADIKAVLPAALVGGRMDSSIGAVAAGAIAAASFAANALDAVWSTASRLLTAGTNIVLAKGTGVTGLNDLDASGVRGAVGLASANLDTQLAALQSDTDNIQTRIPAALVGGKIDANLGSVTAAAITAAAFAANALDAVWATATRLLTAGTNIVLAKGTGVTGFNDLAATGVENAVWNTVLSSHLTALSTGAALNAAGSAGDPWSTALPGAYGAGTAGKIIGDNNAGIIAIGAKTVNLPSDPADASDIAAAFSAVSGTLTTLGGYSVAIKAKTDNLPAAPAAVGDIPSANANADALLDRANGVETGWTLRQVLRIVFAALGGTSSGLATATALFRAGNDSKVRINATVDADGNRSVVTLDAS